MTDPNTGATANIGTPTVGLTLPTSPAMEAALDQYQAAKQAHAANPTDDTQAAKQHAADELRYQRWIVRGGPGQTPTRATQALHDRYDTSREG